MASVSTIFSVCSLPSHADMRAHRRLAALRASSLSALSAAACLLSAGMLRRRMRLLCHAAVRRADVRDEFCLQPEHRQLEHGARLGHESSVLVATACRHAGYRRWRRSGPRPLSALAAACLLSAGIPRRLWRKFGVICIMLRCGAQVFRYAPAFNQNIGGWNTASASTMGGVRSRLARPSAEVFRMLVAVACRHAGLSPLAALRASSLVCSWLQHVCSRLGCFASHRAALAFCCSC